MAHIIDIDDYLKLPAPKSVIEEGGVVRLVVMGSQFHIPCALDKAGSYVG